MQFQKGEGKGKDAAKKAFESQAGGLQYIGILNKLSLKPVFKHYVCTRPAFDCTDPVFKYTIEYFSMDSLQDERPDTAKQARQPSPHMLQWGWAGEELALKADSADFSIAFGP